MYVNYLFIFFFGVQVMLILKGLPGSGKSYLAEKISQLYENVVVCSADKFFLQDGKWVTFQHQLFYNFMNASGFISLVY